MMLYIFYCLRLNTMSCLNRFRLPNFWPVETVVLDLSEAPPLANLYRQTIITEQQIKADNVTTHFTFKGHLLTPCCQRVQRVFFFFFPHSH